MRIQVIIFLGIVVLIALAFELGLKSEHRELPQSELSALVSSIDFQSAQLPPGDDTDHHLETPTENHVLSPLYPVVAVIDGDTIDVMIDMKVERIRLIGINTPETVDPRKPIECFGVEASEKAKKILSTERVRLLSDDSQGERDSYQRLLRYVILEDGTNFNLQMIAEGYAYEYTYDKPYVFQAEFKEAENNAQISRVGLWGALCEPTQSIEVTMSEPVSSSPDTSCSIKGNINTSGEKIYHVVGCDSYNNTKIDQARGEQWFCSEREAESAGWRKATNCS